MEITKREIILSISIFAILSIIGMLIYNLIETKIDDKNYIYDTAANIENTEMFQWNIDTNVGNAFIYGELKALQPQICPYDNKPYYLYNRIYEEEHFKSRLETYTSNGKTKTRTVHYWEWDVMGSEQYCTSTVQFCGIPFSEKKFSKDSLESLHIGTDVFAIHKRYKYFGVPLILKGTIFTDINNNTILDNNVFNSGLDIAETLKSYKSKFWLYFFLVSWIILEIGIIFLFYYLDNNWLNKDKK